MTQQAICVQVKFDNGDSLKTMINTDLQGAKDYYLGKQFNLGVVDDLLVKAVSVEEV